MLINFEAQTRVCIKSRLKSREARGSWFSWVSLRQNGVLFPDLYTRLSPRESVLTGIWISKSAQERLSVALLGSPRLRVIVWAVFQRCLSLMFEPRVNQTESSRVTWVRPVQSWLLYTDSINGAHLVCMWIVLCLHITLEFQLEPFINRHFATSNI